MTLDNCKGCGSRGATHEHPGPVMYTCEWCGTVWRLPVSAAFCCDPTVQEDE